MSRIRDYVTKNQMIKYSDFLVEDENIEDKLDKIPFEKIERYVRKKKLDKIRKKK